MQKLIIKGRKELKGKISISGSNCVALGGAEKAVSESQIMNLVNLHFESV